MEIWTFLKFHVQVERFKEKRLTYRKKHSRSDELVIRMDVLANSRIDQTGTGTGAFPELESQLPDQQLRENNANAWRPNNW